jgi:hypothetical protein
MRTTAPGISPAWIASLITGSITAKREEATALPALAARAGKASKLISKRAQTNRKQKLCNCDFTVVLAGVNMF